jgi:hypothetical protein
MLKILRGARELRGAIATMDEFFDLDRSAKGCP